MVFSDSTSTSFSTPLSYDASIVEFFQSGFNGAISEAGGTAFLMALCLIASLIFSSIIGYSREKNGYPAGLRTHILLSLGSTLIMLLSIYGVPGEYTRDPMRLAAAGVTGIGFLGAGSIMQNGFSIKGLTSAASIWVTMAIGMACGCGYFLIGALTTFFTFIALTLFRTLEIKASAKSAVILLVTKMNERGFERVLTIADNLNINVSEIATSLVKEGDGVYLRMTFKANGKKKGDTDSLVYELKKELEPIECKILR